MLCPISDWASGESEEFIGTSGGQGLKLPGFVENFEITLDILQGGMVYCSSSLGEVSEWFKEPVLKTGDSERGRGFESHLLRLQLSNCI